MDTKPFRSVSDDDLEENLTDVHENQVLEKFTEEEIGNAQSFMENTLVFARSTYPFLLKQESKQPIPPENDAIHITEDSLKDLIFDQEYSSPASMMLIAMVGLPACGKTQLFRNLLSNHFKSHGETLSTVGERNDDSLSLYELLALTKPPYKEVHWFPTTKYSTYAYCLASAIQQKKEKEIQNIYFDIPNRSHPASVFGHEMLNNHFREVYNRLYIMSQYNTITPSIDDSKRKQLFRLLTEGLTHVQIWDVGMNNGLRHILPLLIGHLHRCFPVLTLSLERDLPKFKEKIDLSDEKYRKRGDKSLFLSSRSRSQFLLRYAHLGHSSKKGRERVCKIVAITGDVIREDEDQLKDKVRNAIKHDAESLGVKHLIDDDPIIVESNNVESLGKLKDEFERHALRHMNDTKWNLKMSWIFLRSALHKSGQLYIRKADLGELAEECQINDKEFEDFLNVYAGIGSIIYIPEIRAFSHYIVLNPADFFHKLDDLFYPRFNGDLIFGIVTKSSLCRMFGQGDDLQFFECVLTSCAFAVKMKSEKVLYPNKIPFPTLEQCYLVSAIKKQILQESPFDYECFRVIVACSIQPCFVPVTIVDAFLNEKDISLVLNQYGNVTCFEYVDPESSKIIDFCLFTNEDILKVCCKESVESHNLLRCLISACKRSMSDIQRKFKPKSMLSSIFTIEIPCHFNSTKHHNITDELCDSCKKNAILFESFSFIKLLFK